MSEINKKKREEISAGLKKVAQYGVPEIAAVMEYDVGSGKFLDYFKEEVLESLIFQGGSTVRFFEGPYGSGKTHLLDLIRELALDNNMAVGFTELGHDIKLDDWRQITNNVLENIEIRIDTERIRSLDNILLALKRSGQADYKALKNTILPHPGFQRAMLLIFEDDEMPSQAQGKIFSYLRGEKVGAGEMARSGIRGVKGPLSKRNAEQVLKTVLNGLFLLGLNGTLLLFDEAEQIFRINRANPSQKIRVSANLMRRLVDGSASGTLVGTGVVFAVLPGFIDACGNAYPALGQRLELSYDFMDSNPWRQPILTVSSVSSANTPEEFLQSASIKFESLVNECGGNTEGLRKLMIKKGEQIIRNDASSGYRRSLMKVLAALAVDRIEKRG